MSTESQSVVYAVSRSENISMNRLTTQRKVSTNLVQQTTFLLQYRPSRDTARFARNIPL